MCKQCTTRQAYVTLGPTREHWRTEDMLTISALHAEHPERINHGALQLLFRTYEPAKARYPRPPVDENPDPKYKTLAKEDPIFALAKQTLKAHTEYPRAHAFALRRAEQMAEALNAAGIKRPKLELLKVCPEKPRPEDRYVGRDPMADPNNDLRHLAR